MPVKIRDLIPRSHYRAITTIALIVSDRDIQAKTKIGYDLTTVWSSFKPPRHPLEDGGPTSIPKLHQNNITAL